MRNEALMQEMTQLFSDELKLCGVGPEQKVAVLSEGDALQDYAEAFLRGSESLGADTTHVHLASDAATDAEDRYQAHRNVAVYEAAARANAHARGRRHHQHGRQLWLGGFPGVRFLLRGGRMELWD